MDILKLIFEHDILLEELSEKSDPRNKKSEEFSLEDFMKPIPTYSRFYITGTHLDEPQFGLNCLMKHKDIQIAMNQAFTDYSFTTNQGVTFDTLSEAISELQIGDALVCHKESLSNAESIQNLRIDDKSGLRQIIPQLVNLLDNSGPVIFKEKAHDGYDLHIFTKNNLYENLFNHLKPLLSNDLRFFSINGKKVKSERTFYFETYRLEKPPHGFQEVFEQTVV